MTYIPGDYWSIDQRTGLKVRISQLTEEPVKDNPNSGLWVVNPDPVHPQEYVVGIEDDPSVPLSFPDNTQAVGEALLTGNVPQYTTKPIPIPETVSQDDPIGIVMDNGVVFWSFAYSVEALLWTPWTDANGDLLYDVNGVLLTTADPYVGYLVTLGSYIHEDASAGNTVYLPALDNEEWQ